MTSPDPEECPTCGSTRPGRCFPEEHEQADRDEAQAVADEAAYRAEISREWRTR
jgi:hypothetical protein